MKFLFLSSFAHLALDPRSTRVSGGAELQVALLARELVSRGYEAIIASADIGQPAVETFQGVRSCKAGPFHTGSLADSLRALPQVSRLLAAEKPDYVLILGWTTWLFILQVLKPLYGYKLVFICGLDTEVNGEFRRENPVRGALFEDAMRRCDKRFAMTKLQERLFQENGLECGLYRNLILPRANERAVEKTTDFLWVARCQPIKQPHKFLDLAEQLPEAHCEMICPGEDADLFETVRRRAASIPNVTLLDGVPYHEIQARYDASRVLVNTSTYEGWPNSFIQAGLGHAAILSLQVRPDTLFEDFRLGACADGDEKEMLSLAQEWFREPEHTAAMGDESARFVAALHDNALETDAFLAGLGLPSRP